MTEPRRESLRGLLTQRWLVIALFVLQALVLTGLAFKNYPWLTGDSVRYLALAEALRQGQFGLTHEGAFVPEVFRTLGYPAFLAFCQTLFGTNPLWIVVMQSGLYLASVWLLWRVVARVFGATAGLAFLVLTACYPFVAQSASLVSAEIPGAFLLALALYCLAQRATTPWLAAAGASIGASAYFRPNILLLSVAIAAACLLVNRRFYRGAFALVVMSGVVILPLMIYNYRSFGVFSPTLPSQGGPGIVLFFGSWESRVPHEWVHQYSMTEREFPELESTGLLAQVREINRQVGMPLTTTPMSMLIYPDSQKQMLANKLLMQQGWANIKTWPRDYLRSVLLTMPRMWYSTYVPGQAPLPVRLGVVGLGLAMLLAGLGGALLALWRIRGAQRLVVLAAAGTLAYFTLTLCWFHIEARYTIPARLLLLVFAAYAVTQMPALWRVARHSVAYKTPLQPSQQS
jgi:hypothetical protein